MIYYFIGKQAHESVRHSSREYMKRAANGEQVMTNTVEGYFSILKRGGHGTYHHVSRKHLHRYLSEFDFRYNARDITDGGRATLAVDGADGKGLMYWDYCRGHEKAVSIDSQRENFRFSNRCGIRDGGRWVQQSNRSAA